MIFITGATGSGKSTLLSMFVNSGFVGIDTGNFWRSYFSTSDAQLANKLREEKSSTEKCYWEYEMILAELKKEKNFRDIVISGYRNIKNINEFRRVAYMNSDFDSRKIVIINIKSSDEVSLDRYIKRENASQSIGQDNFKKDLETDYKWGVGVIAKYANEIFQNDGDLSQMQDFVNNILKKYYYTF